MKFLERLVDEGESRFTTDDYVSWVNLAGFGGNPYPIGNGVNLTQSGQRTVPMSPQFAAQVAHGYQANGIVWTCASVRMQVFSQARLTFQRLRNNRPADFFGTAALGVLERPWAGGTTQDLLAAMIGQADFGGNAYVTVTDDAELVLLRPDWVDVVLELTYSNGRPIGFRPQGYAFYPEGARDRDPTPLRARDVAHFAPYPDPSAPWRGMSWLTPVIREVASDKAATTHKQAFFDNAATPNLSVKLSDQISPEAFEDFVEKMDRSHEGARNAYKTLYLGGGADVTVVGADMKQLDFKAVQGAGETRIAAASGVGAIIAQLSEGMAGSSLNAGNYNSARRRFSDVTMRHAWSSAAGCLSQLVDVPGGARLWYDDRDISFLQEDARDSADIFAANASAARQLVDAGFEPESVVAAVDAGDMTLLTHTELFSVQLQPPGTTDTSGKEEPDNGPID